MLEWLTQIQFILRQKFLGRVLMRRRWPSPPSGNASTKELAFYSLVLKRLSQLSGDFCAFEQVDLLWDVGVRNWSYAKALALAFPKADFYGCELDGGRRYWNLHRRIDAARSMAASVMLEQRCFVRCLSGDFRDLGFADSILPRENAAVSFLFPFVSAHPCRKWGLPSRYADFSALVREAVNGGARLLVSCHQGDWEAAFAAKAYRECDLEIREGLLDPREFSSFWPSPYPVYLFAGFSRRGSLKK